MAINTKTNNIGVLKEQMHQIIPDSKTFIKYVNPYFFRIEDDYVKVLKILKIIGAKNGIEGTWGLLCDTYRDIFKNESVLENMIRGFQLRLPEAERALKNGEGLKGTIKVFTWDGNSLIFIKQLFESIPDKKRNKINKLDKNTKALPPQEQELCKEFNLFIHKLFINYIVTHLPTMPGEIIKIFIKYFLLEYYNKENEMYGKEIVSEKLIHHIKSIHIIGEKKLLQDIKDIEKHKINGNSKKPDDEFNIACKFETPIKAYSPKEFADIYNVTQKTFNSWINKHSEKIGKLSGKRYTPKQVRIIFNILGEPPDKL